MKKKVNYIFIRTRFQRRSNSFLKEVFASIYSKLIISVLLVLISIAGNVLSDEISSKGSFSYLPAEPTYRKELPRLDSKIAYENKFCYYQDKIPFVKKVNWENEKIQKAMSSIAPGWFSTFSYREWQKPYGLERVKKDAPEEIKKNVKVRNFIRVLCGEFRDYPEMLDAKLNVLINAQVYASAKEMKGVDTSKNLFHQITYPAYQKMLRVMGGMHSYRQNLIKGEKDSYDYAQGKQNQYSKRVDNSVAPCTHCEMKFMFSHYMIKDAPPFDPETYEKEYQEFKKSCTNEDFDYMYNFRGHKNFKPLWLESNAFIWNSRRGWWAYLNRNNKEYYLRPFANRYQRSRQLLAAYLYYPDKDHSKFALASERGGGPILYVTDQDKDNNGIADYKLFKKMGCGDQGVGGDNCNKVTNEKAYEIETTKGAIGGWKTENIWRKDMGLFLLLSTFEKQMARLNQALDRHTNWGPTSYYAINASKVDATPKQIKYMGAYSPIVACSYDISASDIFASGDYPTTHPFERGKTKWMFVMRFKSSDYYSEQDLENESPINFDKSYFNETSLSNDYYRERALDRFGWIPKEDIHANVYFAYGASGLDTPKIEIIPLPNE